MGFQAGPISHALDRRTIPNYYNPLTLVMGFVILFCPIPSSITPWNKNIIDRFSIVRLSIARLASGIRRYLVFFLPSSTISTKFSYSAATDVNPRKTKVNIKLRTWNKNHKKIPKVLQRRLKGLFWSLPHLLILICKGHGVSAYQNICACSKIFTFSFKYLQYDGKFAEMPLKL